MKTLILLLIVALTGCSTHGLLQKPPVAHSVTGTMKVQKIALSQNPLTGMYEAGIQWGQFSFAVMPIVYTTNSSGAIIDYVVPDGITRAEDKAGNGIFGRAGTTWTFAIGKTAVQQLLGGAAVSINQNTDVSVSNPHSPQPPTTTPSSATNTLPVKLP
jgi:hypothetical protein